MFCYQCQETAGNKGCTKVGVCGKNEDVANLQDLLIYTTKGLAGLIVKKGRLVPKSTIEFQTIFSSPLPMQILMKVQS